MNISIVISSYNGSSHIIEQLDSIRNQTRTPDEVLICDDCSTDSTPEIVNKYIKIHSLNNWRIVINQENKGWQRNFIDGIEKSTGDLIFTCDQDDIWRTDKLEIMENIMLKHPEINLLASNYLEFYEDGHTKTGPLKNTKKLEKVKLKNNYMLVGAPGCTHCFRRSLFNQAKKIWFKDYPHDALLWRTALFSDSLYFYTDDLIKWRKHNDSAFSKDSRAGKTKANKEKWLDYDLAVADGLEKFLSTLDIDTNRQIRMLDKNRKWISLRKKFYQTKNILTGLHLLFYWNYYPRYRQYLADWYLIFIKG